MICFYRTTFEDLENFSSTDLKQQWGKLKEGTTKLYKPKPLKNFCHVNMSQQLVTDEETDEKNREVLLKAAYGSSLSKCLKGRRQNSAPVLNKDNMASTQSDFTKLFMVLNNNSLVTCMGLSRLDTFCSRVTDNGICIRRLALATLPDGARKFYSERVCLDVHACADLCRETMEQTGVRWNFERRMRVTGSSSHHLYTYGSKNGQNWDQKARKHVTPSSFKGTADTLYGKKMEPIARTLYENLKGQKVQQLGLVVLPCLPWVAFSPDGVLCNNDKPELLVEIKCPKILRHVNVNEAIDKNMLHFIEGKSNNARLKERHQYYSQVQLGMFIFDVKYCDLVLLSEEKDVFVINVKRNDVFVADLLKKLQWVYFLHILPAIVNYNK